MKLGSVTIKSVYASDIRSLLNVCILCDFYLAGVKINAGREPAVAGNVYILRDFPENPDSDSWNDKI